MRTRTRWALALATMATPLMLLATAVPAGAATGPAVSNPGQAGFSVTGARIQQVGASVFLRNAHQFAPEVAGVGGSVSLQASDGELVLLGISTGTGAAHEPYSPGVTVYSGAPYNGTTEVATQNDASVNGVTCTAAHVCTPGDHGLWADQQNVALQLHYNRSQGTVYFQEQTAAGDTYTGHYHIGVGLNFTRPEITVDFGTWASTHDGYLAAPAAVTQYLTWRDALLESYSGHFAGLNSWWMRHHVVLSGAPGGARAGSLFNSGTAFRTYLTP